MMHAPITYIPRLRCIIYIMLLLISFIVIRLIWLQIIYFSHLFELSTKNFLRTELVILPRGNILDSHGNLLATNRPMHTVYWHGTGNKSLHNTHKKMIAELAHILQKDLTELTTEIYHAEKRGIKTLLAQDISFEQLSTITELFPQHPNILVQTNHKRFYPYTYLASHILGHINTMNMQLIGKMGLEKILQEQLCGKPGTILKKINSLGSGIEQQFIYPPLAGQDIQTTLDLELQTVAEEVFPQNTSGTLILLNPRDGAIVALVSRPHFDPTIFLDAIAHQDWQELNTGNRFLNRAFNACYPPASIFKLVTISAALEQGIVHLDDSVRCKGYFHFCKHRYHCMRRSGHGTLTLVEAVAKSCNILFYDIATKISIDLLAHYAHQFGLGTQTGIIFPEKSGLIPTKAWKLQEKGERWWPGETLPCSIGQGPLLATPLQVACMISSIFEGYLVNPRILTDEIIHRKPLNIQDATRRFLKKSMKLVAITGTGRMLHSISGMKIYAKTGTAQTCSLSYEQDTPTTKPHAWCVVYFTPENGEPLTLVILIEHAGSSRVATHVACEFLDLYKYVQQDRQKNRNHFLN